jgi:hypothetical protein
MPEAIQVQAVHQQAEEILSLSDIETPSLEAVEENLNTLASTPKLPSYVKTRNVRDQFQFAFELIGGIPRLAHWAHQNPDKFFALYSKLIPTQVSGTDGGPVRVQLSWLNARDTTGRSASQIIDVNPVPSGNTGWDSPQPNAGD